MCILKQKSAFTGEWNEYKITFISILMPRHGRNPRYNIHRINRFFEEVAIQLRERTVISVMPAHESVCPRGKAQLPIEKFPWNFIIAIFNENFQHHIILAHVTKKNTLRKYLHIFTGCWKILSPTRKETSYNDQTLTSASHSKTKNQKVVRPTRSPRKQWPPRRDEKWRPFNCFLGRVGLRTYQHPCIWLIFTIEKTRFFCEVRPQMEGNSDDLIQKKDRNNSNLILWLW